MATKDLNTLEFTSDLDPDSDDVLIWREGRPVAERTSPQAIVDSADIPVPQPSDISSYPPTEGYLTPQTGVLCASSGMLGAEASGSGVNLFYLEEGALRHGFSYSQTEEDIRVEFAFLQGKLQIEKASDYDEAKEQDFEDVLCATGKVLAGAVAEARTQLVVEVGSNVTASDHPSGTLFWCKSASQVDLLFEGAGPGSRYQVVTTDGPVRLSGSVEAEDNLTLLTKHYKIVDVVYVGSQLAVASGCDS